MTQRIITGALLIAALIVLLYFGGWVFSIAVCLAFSIAIFEEHRALKQRGYNPVCWVSFAALILSVPVVMLYSYVAIMPILALFSFCALLQITLRTNPNLDDVMFSVLPMLSVVLPGMCIIGIAASQPRSMQLFLLVLLFSLSAFGDSCALFVGTWLGGRKLCPNISPKKTVSGAIGGLVGSTLLAAVVGWIFQLSVPEISFPPVWANLLVGFLGGAAGQVGDLFASMIKRHCNIKDFSNLLPGHGGMLDRLDSILFTALIVYCYRVILLAAF